MLDLKNIPDIFSFKASFLNPQVFIMIKIILLNKYIEYSFALHLQYICQNNISMYLSSFYVFKLGYFDK